MNLPRLLDCEVWIIQTLYFGRWECYFAIPADRQGDYENWEPGPSVVPYYKRAPVEPWDICDDLDIPQYIVFPDRRTDWCGLYLHDQFERLWGIDYDLRELQELEKRSPEEIETYWNLVEALQHPEDNKPVNTNYDKVGF